MVGEQLPCLTAGVQWQPQADLPCSVAALLVLEGLIGTFTMEHLRVVSMNKGYEGTASDY